jgi:tRNA-dihydrouridine synthase A
MVDVTDRHFRYFCRLLTKKSMLYTEMITSSAIIHGDRKKLLDFDPIEKPIALQIAGCDKREIAEAVKIAEDWDYDEINLNVGCPSDRVSGNQMGAALMAYPELVAEIIQAMKRETKKPVTVKHRIGIDGTNVLPSSLPRVVLDIYEDLEHFVKVLSQAGVKHFIIHARIAILEGLSPKENREIPPLRYEDVYQIKKSFPELFIEINGGIRTIEAIKEHLKYVDGVMLGRVAYENPFILTEVDQFTEEGEINSISRREVIEKLIEYVARFGKDQKKGIML